MRSSLPLILAVVAGCSSASANDPSPPSTPTDRSDPFDVPIQGVTSDLRNAFLKGDDLFDLPFREADGLGPLYIRISCGSCHTNAVRGPGVVQKFALVEADGFTPATDQSTLTYGHTARPLMAAGATVPLLPPTDVPSLKVTGRVGPPLLGSGYMEAVLDSEIERVAAEQAARTDDIHGHPNHVIYPSEPNPDTRFHTHQKGDLVIGRFGVKARQATLDDFTADALQGDMGITSPMRPVELPNPDLLTDDLKPGVDATIDHVNGVAMYLRLIAIPKRVAPSEAGRALFDQAKCSVCHVSTMKTRPDYPIAQLAGIEAPIYTDLLLHRFSDTDGDGMIEGTANSREWRTAPLMGVRFNKTYLHDGRAGTLEEAITLHGGEAKEAADLFSSMSPEDKKALLDFVGAL